MNTKTKGNIGEAVILSEFTKRGIQVCIPFGDDARYDLVAEFNGKLNKIQVKYCSQETDNDSIMCRSSSSKNHTTNKRMDTYENDVDYIAFYIQPWDTACLVPISECSGYSFTIRRTPTKNNQKSGTHLAEDYSFDKILCVETLHDEPKSE